MKRTLFAFACVLALASGSFVSAQDTKLKYTYVPNFFDKEPGGQPQGPCHGGAAIDETGNIYVTTDTPRGITVFSKDGKFLRAVGPIRIHALEIRKEGGTEYIYAARPSDHEVLKLTLDGEKVWGLNAADAGLDFPQKDKFNPCAVTVAPDGAIWVADGYGSNYLLKFDKDRKFVARFGGPGAEEGKFNTCHGIALDTRSGKPLLLVCNRNNNRVEHWDLDGKFVKVIQKDLRMPAAVNIRGNYAVFPELQGRATVLDKEGNIAAQLGDNPKPDQRANFALPPEQWTEGIINSGHGAALDKDLNVIVSEWSKFGRVHKWARQK